MAHPAGETNDGVLRLDFDRRLMLQFCGSVVTSDAGLLPYRELDDVLGLTVIAGNSLADARTGKNGRHALVGLLRQSVFSRLAGYEDVNDAGSLRHAPAMRWIVGGKAALTHLFSGGRESGSLRVPRSRGDKVCDPVTGEPCPAREDCISADAAGRTTSERDAAIPREFHLSGRLDEAAPGDRQGRVASG